MTLLACAPTEPDPNAIIELEESQLPPQMPSSLTGTSWRLVGYDSFESGHQRETPASGEVHIIRFDPGGQLRLQLACNHGTGRWSADQREPDRGSVEIDVVGLTEAVCPGARMTRIVQDLEYVGSYVIADGRLVLNLRADSGNLVWERVE